MLSLVNYGSSDSENESGDDEPMQKTEPPACSLKALSRNLPAPSVHKLEIAEENDEFLQKKAIPTAVPPKKGKVKIMIPRLSDLKNDDDDDEKELVKKIPTAAKKSGLLSLLPRPSQSFAPAPKPVNKHMENNTVPQKPSSVQKPHVVTASVEPPKKVGLVPYALMSHNPKAQSSAKKDESDDEDDSGSFFTFDSKIDELPKVSDEEVRALVAEESKRLELRKRQGDDSLTDSNNYNLSEQAEQQQQRAENQNFDAEAMKALMGGNRAKRSRVDDIQIIDLSAAEVLPNRDEWLRKTLAGETSYMPTGNIVEKGPTALSKKKHQISYLSMRAESNEAELEAMWASNRQTKRESKSKYGF